MSIRRYQHEFVDATLAALVEVDRVLSVAPTGSGKTVMAGEIIRRAGCAVLFLADAKELVWQAADKLGKWAGIIADVEMGEHNAQPGMPLIVATTQSIARRLEKYPRHCFGLIVVDEAHRNTLGDQAQKVLGYFSSAQVIGITATPHRTDKKQLGHFYQQVAIEVSLVRLIKESWLSRIVIKSVPAGVHLGKMRTVAGDWSADDVGAAVTPHLDRLAQLLVEHAKDRRTVAFLPLRETSRQFVACCQHYGLRAIHVDGEDRDGIKHFKNGEPGVIANASLLTTGWDEPSVDCVYILRPTKSFVLYSQMVGRGTRIFDGKDHLLLLDPLFLSDSMDLIKPARLIAKTDEEVRDLTAVIESGGQIELFEAEEKATTDRTKRLRERMIEVAKRKSRTVDALDFALALGDGVLASYEPETDWEAQAVTSGQAGVLERAGFDVASMKGKGHASRIIDILFKRRDLGLATPKQIKWLIKFGHPSPHTVSFQEASEILDAKFSKKKEAVAA